MLLGGIIVSLLCCPASTTIFGYKTRILTQNESETLLTLFCYTETNLTTIMNLLAWSYEVKKWVVKLCRQRAKKSVKRGRQQYSMTICGASVKIMIDRASSVSLALSLAYKSWQTNTLWSHVQWYTKGSSKLNLKWIRAFQNSDLIKSLKCRPSPPHSHMSMLLLNSNLIVRYMRYCHL